MCLFADKAAPVLLPHLIDCAKPMVQAALVVELPEHLSFRTLIRNHDELSLDSHRIEDPTFWHGAAAMHFHSHGPKLVSDRDTPGKRCIPKR